MNKHFAPAEVADFAWRIPFLLGGVFGLFSVYLRRWLHETPVFAELKQRKSLAAEIPLKAVLRDHGRAVIVSMLLTWMLSAAIVVVILMTPTLLQKQFHIAPATALLANCVATLCLTIGCVLAGSIAGRIGAGKTIFIGGIALAMSYYMLFQQLAVDTSVLLPCTRSPASRRRDRRDSVRDGQGVPGRRALFGHLVLVQRRVCDVRRTHADRRVADDEIESDGAGAVCRRRCALSVR